MNNKAYESGYLEGKSEGFEQGVSYGANRMFETIFTAYQENGLSLKKLKKMTVWMQEVRLKQSRRLKEG